MNKKFDKAFKIKTLSHFTQIDTTSTTRQLQFSVIDVSKNAQINKYRENHT